MTGNGVDQHTIRRPVFTHGRTIFCIQRGDGCSSEGTAKRSSASAWGGSTDDGARIIFR